MRYREISEARDDREALRADVEQFRRSLEARYPGLTIWFAIGPSGNLILSQIVVHTRNRGTGTAVMQDLTNFADRHQLPITLTPDRSYGGSVTRLRQFYRRFGFGRNKDHRYSESMLRHPRMQHS